MYLGGLAVTIDNPDSHTILVIVDNLKTSTITYVRERIRKYLGPLEETP